jgi:hypothetical protein
MPYSRANPSQRYVELVNIYKTLHESGDKLNEVPAENTFDGRSLKAHVNSITEAVQRYDLRSLLDYGCGKAVVYDMARATARDGRKFQGLKNIWGVDSITFYDPGYAPYRKVPKGRFDGVICTDVLEHCPEADIDWIMDELFGFAEKFLYCTIACYPAEKLLPNGDNAHETLKNPGWWIDRIADASAKRPKVKYVFSLSLHDSRLMVVQGGGAAIEPK